MDVYAGYYGALTTVSLVFKTTTGNGETDAIYLVQLVWSPDGRYVLVSIQVELLRQSSILI